MRKIALLGIAAGVVLGIGIFANIRLFGNNALAYQTSTEQKIKTIFWSVTNQEYGLKKIMNGIYAMKKDMKNDLQAMNDDLLQKKSFYEVEDVVGLENSGVPLAVTVKLVNCDDAIPLEKRAFSIVMLGVRIAPVDSLTILDFDDTIVDRNYFATEPELQDLTKTNPQKAFTEPLGASDQVQFTYESKLVEVDFDNGIPFKVVAVGQMPQGCEITVDADDEIDEFEPFPGV